MPRLRSIGCAPAATDFTPSLMIAWAITVAVVVPSPARELLLRGDLAHELRAHVLELVGKLDLLGDSYAILGDARRAPGFVEHDVAALGPERHPDGIGENIDAAQQTLASILRKPDFLGGHDGSLPIKVRNSDRAQRTTEAGAHLRASYIVRR